VTTAGAQNDLTLVVQSSFGKKSGVATINELDDASLEKSVRRSEELARLAPENPEFMPPLGPQEYVETPTYVAATANITPAYRAQVAADSIQPARAESITAAGFFQDNTSFAAMMNSNGLFAYNRSTGMNFSVTMRTEDGTGSGYVSRDYNDVDRFDSAAASKIALDKAVMSKEARAVEPGKYTVILEPEAAIGLLQNMLFNMSARQADEGRSFLAKAGGGTRLGEKIVDERVTIYSDPTHPDVPAPGWNQDGRPAQRTAWIENGVVRNLFYDRYWADKQGVEATPAPSNGIMEGGAASLDELIAGTQRGILVTRLWYIRTVDPQTLLYTGLTRDGTFFIENGQIRYPIKNFRFNESPIIMLNNLEALGRPMRTGGNLVPPLKVRDFTFSSLSDAV
jgi:predicted Zn-dependent protease